MFSFIKKQCSNYFVKKTKSVVLRVSIRCEKITRTIHKHETGKIDSSQGNVRGLSGNFASLKFAQIVDTRNRFKVMKTKRLQFDLCQF